MYISILIPAYNEESRLEATLSKISTYLKNKDFDYEVIVIDDGSVDKTQEIALSSSLYKEKKLIILKNEQNRGKGFSVKKGIIASNGEVILFTDSDLSTPIEELDKLIKEIDLSFDIVIGSRSIAGSQIKVRQPFYREYMGRFFNVLVQFFVIKGIVDTQCGFKLFKASVAKEIALKLKIDGFSFDAEMLYLASKKGYKVKEVPVVWINSPTSKVRPVHDSFKMFLELLSIKKNHNED